ncbi:UNKNOWN [Stylonychia lemnae]|uniref:Uncharacterized protein n=1 Tax=Stylonychia lemnae TaxID=5949 RepID=A0A078B373_STYLE|nr:UNKNOWN [Stylonychia lemnae]|eukprot:CDW87943.1 UNKNOWN [Stylonychia lemnae]
MSSDQENLFKESVVLDKIMLHPSDMVNFKHSIVKELNKKLIKWDDQLKGILVSYQNVCILNGGKGRIMDDFAWIQYVVRYKVTYAQPKVDQKLRHMTLLVYNMLTVIVQLDNLDSSKYEIKNATLDILSDDQDEDFDIDNKKNKIEIMDKQKGQLLSTESTVEVKITKLSISSGNVILFGSLI